MIHEEIYDLIIGESLSVGDRVYYPVRGLGAAFPVAEIAQDDYNTEYHLAGPTGVVESIFKITVFDTDFVALYTAVDELKFLFNGYRGNLTTLTNVAISVAKIADGEIYQSDGGEELVFSRYLTIKIEHSETTI